VTTTDDSSTAVDPAPRPTVRLGIRFDLRVPEFSPTDHRQQYAAALEMSAWAERLGFRFVALSEHHGTPDGYLSAPFTLAAAILGRTSTIKLNVAAALLPLHDPVRLAEQLATLDLIAPGRFSFVAGAGYRHDEFQMAGVARSERGKLLEEYVHVLRSAWTGEPFEWHGRSVVVTPKPATLGGPRLALGGSVVAAARRAARLHLPLFASIADPEVRREYEEACVREGYTSGSYAASSGPAFVMVSDDVEATWAEIGPYALFDASSYDEWQDTGHDSSFRVRDATAVDDIRSSGIYRVVTPEECVELARQQRGLTLHPLMGGIPAPVAWRSLELFRHEVLPALTE
jgi:alkanesulfonate monooxygenase SsuD/methylene tetrahydromethanopterin reductase-like flavin-dependent oxidoreductase (luciferase family)